MELLGRQPGAGHSRAELTDLPVNFWPLGGVTWSITYRADIRPLQILRVLHGMQDVESILQ